MGTNVAITSLYTGLSPGVNTIANLSMWWPQTGSPTPAEYISIRTGGMQWYLEQQNPAVCRTMWLNNLLMWEMVGTDPFMWLNKGIDLKPTLSGLKPLSAWLKKYKVPVELLFCDVEANFSYWAVGKEKVQQILRDSKCRSKMPTYAKKIDPNIFDRPSDPGIHAAICNWGRFASEFNLKLVKKIAVDSGLFNIKDSKGKTHKPCVVNFSFQKQRWQVNDLNGWPHVNATVDGKSSNPSLYLYTQEWGPFVTEHVHHSLWNRLIYTINMVRTSIGYSGHRVFPILDKPSARHPWVWEQMVAHCIRAGITLNNGQWFLYWNPEQNTMDDDLAAQIFARHDQPWPKSKALPQIPYDVDSFETNGFVTTYTDFLDKVLAVPPDTTGGEEPIDPKGEGEGEGDGAPEPDPEGAGVGG